MTTHGSHIHRTDKVVEYKYHPMAYEIDHGMLTDEADNRYARMVYGNEQTGKSAQHTNEGRQQDEEITFPDVVHHDMANLKRDV